MRRLLPATAVLLRGVRFTIARVLCRACGVFAATLVDGHAKGVGVSDWCSICRANRQYANGGRTEWADVVGAADHQAPWSEG